MTDECRILIDELCFDKLVVPYDGSKDITFKNVLGAVWTIEIFFYRPFGIKLQLPLDLRSKRVLLQLKCQKVRRRVYVETKIRIKSKNSKLIDREEVFLNYIKEGDSSIELGTDFENENDDIFSLKVSGELKIYVNTENYFYYKHNMSFLPEQSKIQAIHLQMMKELSNDFMASLFLQENTSDVVLRCGSNDYKAHKFVLSARSKVFSTIFQNPMKESETNVVEIKEMSCETLKDVLEYIYSGKVQTFDEEKAFEFVSAAEQYDLPGLKKLSVYYIYSKLSATNALSTLAFAQLYDEDLKNKTIDYICKEFDHLKNTEEWKIFQNVQPMLANEVLLKIIQLVDSEKEKNQSPVIKQNSYQRW